MPNQRFWRRIANETEANVAAERDHANA